MKAIDHSGVRYNMVTGISPTDKRHSGQVVWLWACDCGSVFEATPSDFVRGKRVSCTTCSRDKKIRSATVHGYDGTKEYTSWRAIKERCLNPNSNTYPYYGGIGITVSEDIAKSFLMFLEEVGPYPLDGKRYTCGRIDHTKGYAKGNIRWETNEKQARSHGKRADNTSGVTGVYFRFAENAWCAAYSDPQGKRHVKLFSVNKCGNEEAFNLACHYRDDSIKKLNEILGDQGYSEDHGKQRRTK